MILAPIKSKLKEKLGSEELSENIKEFKKSKSILIFELKESEILENQFSKKPSEITNKLTKLSQKSEKKETIESIPSPILPRIPPIQSPNF